MSEPLPDTRNVDPNLTISAAWTQILLRALGALGLSAEQLCGDAGLDYQTAMDSDARVPRDLVGRLWITAIKQSGDRFLGLHAGDNVTFVANNLPVHLLMSSPTLEEGLRRGFQFQKLLAHGEVASLHGVAPNTIEIRFQRIGGALSVSPHEIEFMLTLFVRFCQEITQGHFQPERVLFEHPFRGGLEEYSQIFGCDVSFGEPRNALVMPAETLRRPLAHHSRAVYQQLEAVAESLASRLSSPGLIHEVGNRIRDRLATGSCDVDTIASMMALSSRTLQRRLSEEGTSFRALMEATRQAVALECFERGLDIAETSRRAGFSNSRAFARALRRWNESYQGATKH
ncbi:MAG: AraC family transcriptional regulator [Polyangiales bacterium]